MIVHRSYAIDRTGFTTAGELADEIERKFVQTSLRWFISSASPGNVVVESTEYAGELPQRPRARTSHRSRSDVVVSLVPTGIACSIGGFAGDAAPATALLARAADFVVTNPNAVNASNFINLGARTLYTEGSCIDAFSRAEINLRPARGNKVGLIIDAAEDTAISHVLNVTNAVRAVHGVDVIDYVVTDRPLGTRCVRSDSGAYVGSMDAPDSLLKAAEELVARGAEAIAVTTTVQGLDRLEYSSHFRGVHANPVGGVEAIVSHLVVRALRVPAAHAPMMNFKDLELDHPVVDARSAGELVSLSGLACVLIGLSSAPRITLASGDLGWSDVVAVVAPADALGGIPVLEALRNVSRN